MGKVGSVAARGRFLGTSPRLHRTCHIEQREISRFARYDSSWFNQPAGADSLDMTVLGSIRPRGLILSK